MNASQRRAHDFFEKDLGSFDKNGDGLNYTKRKPVFGKQCPKCKEPLRMLFFRNNKNSYVRSDIQLCPRGCRIADILTPIYPLENKLVSLEGGEKKMAHIQTLLSLNLLQLEAIQQEKQLTISTNDDLLGKFFITDVCDSGVYLCQPCFDTAYEKLTKQNKQTLITIYPIKPTKKHQCFICASKQLKRNAEVIVRVRALEKQKAIEEHAIQ